jgi:hypothetical protein
MCVGLTMFVHLSAGFSLRSTGWIYMKFGMDVVL